MKSKTSDRSQSFNLDEQAASVEPEEIILPRFLILGNQGMGKTDLAYILAGAFGLPVYDGVTKVEDIQEMEGIYVSNSIAIEEVPTLKNIHVINIAKY